MIEKTIYVSNDGHEFDTEYDCLKYEQNKLLEKYSKDIILNWENEHNGCLVKVLNKNGLDYLKKSDKFVIDYGCPIFDFDTENIRYPLYLIGITKGYPSGDYLNFEELTNKISQLKSDLKDYEEFIHNN